MVITDDLKRSTIFIYVNKKAAERPEVKEFVEFYLKNAPKLVKQVKYVPLPDRAYKLAGERFTRKVTGTVFGGEPKIGMKIEDLLKLDEKKERLPKKLGNL